MTEIKKERLVLIPFEELHGFQIQSISQVLIVAKTILGQIEPADTLITENVGPEVGSVPDTFDLAADIPAEAVIGRSNFKLGIVMSVAGQMPLADHPRLVAISR